MPPERDQGRQTDGHGAIKAGDPVRFTDANGIDHAGTVEQAFDHWLIVQTPQELIGSWSVPRERATPAKPELLPQPPSTRKEKP